MAELKKEITLLSGIGQMSTTLLGTGLFMVPAIAAGIAGEHSLWSWLVLLIAICPVALTFAMLGKQYPSAGGTAFFVRKAFSQRLEKSIAWLFLSVIPVGVPAAVTMGAGFLQPILPESMNHPLVAQVITVILLMVVNLSGAKVSGQVQTVIALSIVTLVASFWWFGDVSVSEITMPAVVSSDWFAIGTALSVMFWCFVGIEAFAHMGEEFKSPERDFPIAIIVGCLVAGVVYWACSVVVLKFHAYGTAEFDSGSIPYLANLLYGPKVQLLITLIGFATCFASINLYTQSLSRMLWAQARDYMPTSRLAELSGNGVPSYATLAVGAMLLLSCFIGEISQLDLEFFLKLANGVFVLIYLMAMLSACKLLTGTPKVLAYLSLVICVIMMACVGWSMLYALVLFAVLVYRIKPDQNTQSSDVPAI
ncbi:L-methionine/branched-chain amino acid transporter [Vibrio panuliri]|uniref:L-methionine/branched-chain amino acid transporter n=1 Tax=Vibrio panuliri TaxID=1381081 RepID=A0A1Q9HHT3_9VIBR|nr:L-methionine/branched-chain amino acid transporter [Vibrio panuliri]KAB1457659.1 L-methionine/branched-chain amino acid transporter [Vibrio panuliri]OLQ89686.1 L-methionine/branched-chain amino acid transporter [Vibrio panuliri]OLQ96563.1 L-methionine/branched-chain amino acid transporter [Vibrio panuliri]